MVGFAAFAPCTWGLCPAYSSRPMGWTLSVAPGLTLTPRVHSAKAGFIELFLKLHWPFTVMFLVSTGAQGEKEDVGGD